MTRVEWMCQGKVEHCLAKDKQSATGGGSGMSGSAEAEYR